MIEIREYFNQRGQGRFSEWTGEELKLLPCSPTVDELDQFPLIKRAAYDRCMAIIVELAADLKEGKIIAARISPERKRVDMTAELFCDSAADRSWHNGADALADLLTDKNTSWFIRSESARVLPMRSNEQPLARGRPKTYDWEGALIEAAHYIHVNGVPDRKTKKAFVEHLETFLNTENGGPHPKELAKRVNSILRRFGAN